MLGAGFAAADTWLPHPTVAVVGDKATQMVLLKTPETRVAVVVGPWSDELGSALLPLIGWARRRIDLLIFSDGETSPAANSWGAGQTVVQRVLVVNAPTNTPPGSSKERRVERSSMIELDAGVRVRLEPRRAVMDNAGQQSMTPWAVMFERGPLRIWLLEDAPSADWLPQVHFAALVAFASGDAGTVLSALHPGAIAVNASSTTMPPTNSAANVAGTPALVRIFPEEPAVFELTDHGLRLPPWARRIDLSTMDAYSRSS